MTQTVDINNIPNYIFKAFAELNTQRVVVIALPFLALHSKTAMVSSIGIGCYQVYTLWTTTPDKTTTGNKWTEAALLTSTTALSYFFPGAQFILSNGVSFAVHSYRLVKDDSWQKRGKTLYQIAQQAIYISSINYGTSGWLCASLLSQAGNELIQAWESYHQKKENKTPETIALLLLAMIRVIKASTYLPRDFSLIRAKKAESSLPPLIKKPLKDPEEKKAEATPVLTKSEVNSSTPPEVQSVAVEKVALQALSTEPQNAIPVIEQNLPAAVEKVALQALFAEPQNPIPVVEQDLPIAVEKIALQALSAEPLEPIPVIEKDLSIAVEKVALQTPSADPQKPIPVIEQDLPAAVNVSSPSNDPPPQPLKKLTQQDWLSFSQKFSNYLKGQHIQPSYPLKQEEPLDIGAALQKAGFTTEIEGIKFQSTFVNCSFQGLSFKNCKFKYNSFHCCNFDHILFDHCNFTRSIWVGVALQNSCFNECNFSKSRFALEYYRDWSKESPTHLINPQGQVIVNQFNDLEFINCNFFKTFWEHIWINTLKANNSSFIKASIMNCAIKNSTLNDSQFSKSNVFKTLIENTVLSRVDLTRSNWSQSSFDHLTIQEGSLSECSFLQTSVNNSQLIDCNLKDALLLDAKEGFSIQGGVPHQITKPIVAIGWNFDERGSYEKLTTKVLQENNILVLPHNSGSGHHISNQSLLKSEMTDQYRKITNTDRSISQQLLQNTTENSQIDNLKKEAAEILKYADGLILPGGDDIEPCLYHLSPSPQFCFRSLLEIALLSEAHQRKIPTMGICRGAQLINVWHGGTLLQDVRGQTGLHQLEWTDSVIGTELRKKLGDNYKALSMHHQAVDQVGQGLHVVLRRDTIPKMLLSEDGIFIGSQVHPEAYLTIKNSLQEQKLYDHKMLDEIQSINTKEVLEIINTLFQDAQQKTQHHPNNIFLNRHIELLKQNMLSQSEKSIEELNQIFTNRSIYHYFLIKVERFRSATKGVSKA